MYSPPLHTGCFIEFPSPEKPSEGLLKSDSTFVLIGPSLVSPANTVFRWEKNAWVFLSQGNAHNCAMLMFTFTLNMLFEVSVFYREFQDDD